MLNNAAKFSAPEGHIELSVARQNGDVVVRVRDHGIGIAPTMLPRIFDLFSQLQPSLDSDREGLGIGLALVKRLVEMHGGSVQVSSAGIGRGSEFAVRLPVVIPAAELPPALAPQVSDAKSSLRVLVVDDYQDGASSMCRLLELIGHETCMARDGLAGLEAARDFRPHVVLLDIGMPKLNGYEVARQLRAESWGANIVLIAVTGWGRAQDKQRTADAGFDHHLIKPVVPAELTQLLASIAGAEAAQYS